MINLTRIFVLAALILNLLGCGNAVILNDEARAKIKSVAFYKTAVPKHVFYHGPEADLGAVVGGIIGAMISGSDGGEKLLASVKKHKIDIGKIVLNEFYRQLKQEQFFRNKLTRQKKHDAYFKLEVVNYGLVKEGMFESKLIPMLSLRGKLFNRRKEVIWEAHEGMGLGEFGHNSLNLKAYELDNYLNKPDMLRRGFKTIAEIMCQRLIKDLRENGA